jgi:hypothetical protein
MFLEQPRSVCNIGRYRLERDIIIIIIILICIRSTVTFYHISTLKSAHTIIVILTCITDADISIMATRVNVIGFTVIVWTKTVTEQFLYDNRYIKPLLINVDTMSSEAVNTWYLSYNHSHIILCLYLDFPRKSRPSPPSSAFQWASFSLLP